MRAAIALAASVSVAALLGLSGDGAAGSTATDRCFGKKPTISGTNGSNVIRGTPGMDVIVGLNGADRILGLGGADRICGGGGNDRVNGGPGDDQVDLGPGNDDREASPGDDRIYGRGGNDRLFGGPGDDLLNGGPGRDTGNGGPGMDDCVLIEIEIGCEDGSTVTLQIDISAFQHYHPPGASSSFVCVILDGTSGAAYVIVLTGNPVRGSARLEGTMGSGPTRGVFDIFSIGSLQAEVTVMKDGMTARDTGQFTVPGLSVPGDTSCRK